MPNLGKNLSSDTFGEIEPPNSQVLSFDAYGNLTATNNPNAVYTQDVPSTENLDFILDSFQNGHIKSIEKVKSDVVQGKPISERILTTMVKSKEGAKAKKLLKTMDAKSSRRSDMDYILPINNNETKQLHSRRRGRSLPDQETKCNYGMEELESFTNGYLSENSNTNDSMKKPSVKQKFSKKSKTDTQIQLKKSSNKKSVDNQAIKTEILPGMETEKALKNRLKHETSEDIVMCTYKRPTECRKRAHLLDLEEDVNKIKSSLQPDQPETIVNGNTKKKVKEVENIHRETKDKRGKKISSMKKRSSSKELLETLRNRKVKKEMFPRVDSKLIISKRTRSSDGAIVPKKDEEVKKKKVINKKLTQNKVPSPQVEPISSVRKRHAPSQSSCTPSPVPPVSIPCEEEPQHIEAVVDDKEMQAKIPVAYKEGDLVWVYIKGHPMWPALITCPGSELSFTKLIPNKKMPLPSRLYHVLFLNDGSRTLWVRPNCILEFEGRKSLLEYLGKLKEYNPKNPHPMVKTLHQKAEGVKYNKWQEAIKEAESNLPLHREERTKRYSWENSFHNYTSPKRPKKKKRPLKSKRDSKKLQTAFDSNDCDSEDGFSGFDEASSSGEERQFKRRKLKETLSDGIDNFLAKNLANYLEQNKDQNEQTAKKHLINAWNNLGWSQKCKYRNKCSSKDFSYDSDYTSDSDSTISKTKQFLDISKGSYKVPRTDKICQKCFKGGERDGKEFIKCKGTCGELFHVGCVDVELGKEFRCLNCTLNNHACFICKSNEGKVVRCTVPYCSKFYHMECAKKWPQVYKSKVNESKLVCPRHMCHTCAAKVDDMNDSIAKTPPYTRCIECPTTYHTGESCIAAGSEEISTQYHKCTKHLEIPKANNFHCNISWCFCCSKGGQLLLCDQCPAAFHAECLNITTPEGEYVCEDCENGKFPLYGDIVWVKLGHYRWWPGQVLHPKFIPDNIENLAHKQGMFCVHFFGSNDYFWVSRGRVFLYQEGDQGSKGYNSKTIQTQFRKAMDEVVEAYEEQKNRREHQELTRSIKGNKKPAPWVRIDTNRPVGNVRLGKLVLSSVNKCDCNPFSENPCAADDKCLNRMLLIECIREACAAGDRCNNQRFQKRQYPNLEYFRTPSRGWGLRTTEFISKGQFVIEYVGELVDDEELKRRIDVMHRKNEENYYFLTIDKDHIIDAGPKGNLSRFMNHSCHPNCETQKWTVGADTRVGLFAMEDIDANTELTFNYNLECVGTEKKKCNCGGANCSGFIGAKVQKHDKSKLENRKKKRRKKKEIKNTDDTCFRCGNAGDLVLCDMQACPKGYHLSCLSLAVLPKGKWICPWHHCDECGIRSQQRCSYCPNSYCRSHMGGRFHPSPHHNACIDHLPEHLDTKSDGGSSHATSREQSPSEGGVANTTTNSFGT